MGKNITLSDVTARVPAVCPTAAEGVKWCYQFVRAHKSNHEAKTLLITYI